MRPSLFIWIPRTGGTSLWSRLEKPTGFSKPQRVSEPQRPFDPSKITTTFQHVGVGNLLDDETITEEWLARQWTFAIVRNPWARLVSVYQHLRFGNTLRKRIVRDISFDRMIELACAGDIPPVGRYSLCGLSYCNRQTDWLWLGRHGSVQLWLPDYVGRTESLAESWEVIQAYLGVEGTIQRRNRASPLKPAWREYYDDRLRRLVARYEEETIDRFGYTF